MARNKRQRERERRARQFGDDGKREWIMAQPDAITGKLGTHFNPVDPAHIGRTRAAGAGPERMLPLRRMDTHHDYDSMGRERFEAKWGVSHERLIELADDYHRRWIEYKDGLAF